MANFVGYRFNIAEARRLASLNSIRHDVEGAIEYCKRLQSMASTDFDLIFWEALSAAAVVRYARCFSSGARDPLGHGLLNSAPPSLKDAHEYFIAVRSKHVAHSVNEFEENDVTVTLREDGDDISVSGIGAHHERVAGLESDAPEKLLALATWVQRYVNKEIMAEEKRLLPLAHQFGAAKIREFGLPGQAERQLSKRATRQRSKP